MDGCVLFRGSGVFFVLQYLQLVKMFTFAKNDSVLSSVYRTKKTFLSNKHTHNMYKQTDPIVLGLTHTHTHSHGIITRAHYSERRQNGGTL